MLSDKFAQELSQVRSIIASSRMGPYYGKLASRERDERVAPSTRPWTPPPGAGLPRQQTSPAVYAQELAHTPRYASSGSPRSRVSGSPRSSTSSSSRSAASSTLSYRRDDFLPPSHSPSDGSMTSTPRQGQVQQASTSFARGPGPDRYRHVHGCKCHVCQPDLYDGADPRLIKRSAARGTFMEPCVEACRCLRCCEERGDTTVFR